MRKFALIITALLLAMASCDKKYDIVGVWESTKGEIADNGSAGLSSTIATFKDDGYYEDAVFVKTKHFQTEIGEYGRYEIAGDTIIRRPTYLIAGGNSIKADPSDTRKWRIIKLDEKTLTYETNGKTYELTRTSKPSDAKE